MINLSKMRNIVQYIFKSKYKPAFWIIFVSLSEIWFIIVVDNEHPPGQAGGLWEWCWIGKITFVKGCFTGNDRDIPKLMYVARNNYIFVNFWLNMHMNSSG